MPSISTKVGRRALLAAAVAAVAGGPAWAAAGTPITIYRAAGCTCCEGWIKHMQQAGFRTRVLYVNDLSGEWRKRGVPDVLSSCHMGVVGGYVTVGHVPARDVRRLLKERPKAIGVAVPGMPDGSPGMERPDGVRDAYDTLLLLPNGRHRVYAHHA